MKLCAIVLELHLSQNFCHTHTERDKQTDRHFPDIIKSCLGHPKKCKFIQYRKSKIFSEPKLSSIYIEESNNKMYYNCFYSFLLLLSFVLDGFLYSNHCYYLLIMIVLGGGHMKRISL